MAEFSDLEKNKLEFDMNLDVDFDKENEDVVLRLLNLLRQEILDDQQIVATLRKLNNLYSELVDITRKDENPEELLQKIEVLESKLKASEEFLNDSEN